MMGHIDQNGYNWNCPLRKEVEESRGQGVMELRSKVKCFVGVIHFHLFTLPTFSLLGIKPIAFNYWLSGWSDRSDKSD